MASHPSNKSILNNLLIRLGIAGIFLYETICSLFIPPYSLNLLLKQILFVGARSMLVIIIAGLFVGVFISLWLAYGGFDFVYEGKIYGFHPGLIGLIVNLLITVFGSIFINRYK